MSDSDSPLPTELSEAFVLLGRRSWILALGGLLGVLLALGWTGNGVVLWQSTAEIQVEDLVTSEPILGELGLARDPVQVLGLLYADEVRRAVAAEPEVTEAIGLTDGPGDEASRWARRYTEVVKITVDPTARLLYVNVRHDDGDAAARLANAIADKGLEVWRGEVQAITERAQARIASERKETAEAIDRVAAESASSTESSAGQSAILEARLAILREELERLERSEHRLKLLQAGERQPWRVLRRASPWEHSLGAPARGSVVAGIGGLGVALAAMLVLLLSGREARTET